VKSQQNSQGFSVRLRGARLRAGLNQVELAEKLGVSKGAVGNWESGQNPPGDARLRKIAEILSTSADYLKGLVPEDASTVLREGPPAGSLPPATESPYVYISGSTLDRALMDMVARLMKSSPPDRKHIVGNIVDLAQEIERRELTGPTSPADRDVDAEALAIVKQMGESYDRKH